MMGSMEEVEADQLRQAVESMHGSTAMLVQSVPVTEIFEGKMVWGGVVHVFDLVDNPKATRAYAWSSPIEGSTKRRFFAVLHIPPIDSPVAAVRAAIVQEHRSAVQPFGHVVCVKDRQQTRENYYSEAEAATLMQKCRERGGAPTRVRVRG